jgi:steroid delta-isomerase-like uncharacterized protein
MATKTKAAAGGKTKARTPEEVARGSFEAFQARDLDTAVSYWSEEGVEEVIPVGILRGRDEIRENIRAMYAGAPDLEVVLERVVADDRHAVIQWRGAGTFTGEPFNGIEANGRRIELRVVELMDIDDGQIVRNTIYYDGAAFARQIGMMPEQESGAEKAMIAGFNTLTKARRAIGARKSSA